MKINQNLEAINKMQYISTNILNKQYMICLESYRTERYASCKNKFATKYARKHFSQADEDGITLEIIKRLGLKSEKTTFFEIGVGNGLENNTLVLLAMGWKGAWVGAERLAINIDKSTKLKFFNTWVDKNNLFPLYKDSLNMLGKQKHELISIDVDGNDYTFAKELLTHGSKPDIFIIEYNGIFPPGAHWIMPYDKNHLDKNVDYCGHYAGASFSSFVDLFNAHSYKLVACNPMTGVNMFFVHKSYEHLFRDVPTDEDDLYVQPFYDGHIPSFYHKITPKFVESII